MGPRVEKLKKKPRFFFFFFEYIVERTKRKKNLTYGTKKVEGVSFPKHGGKDEDNGERMGMQPE
jgi:hypothetical protein